MIFFILRFFFSRGRRKCSSCFEATHGEPPDLLQFGKCDCDAQRRFDKCGRCCLASVPPRPVSKTTCINVIGDDDNKQVCNKVFSDTHRELCAATLPHLARQLCPACMRAHIGEKVVLEKRENEWREAIVGILKERMGADFVPPDPLYIFGYGSLCYKRDELPSDEEFVGRVRGWRRLFAQSSTDHRGTPERPGLVATLLSDPQLDELGLR